MDDQMVEKMVDNLEVLLVALKDYLTVEKKERLMVEDWVDYLVS